MPYTIFHIPSIKRFLLLLPISTAFFLLTCSSTAFAQASLESEHYKIQLPNFNSGAGIPSSSNYMLNATLGQGPGEIVSSSNYTVRSGFQYIHTTIPFSFSISNTAITFNNLVPQNPEMRTATLTVKAGGAGGYSVKAYENHPLQNSVDPEGTIPDTLCDLGPCNENLAKPWNHKTTYGFGFNITGDDTPVDFGDKNYFRQFADISNGEAPAVIMSKTNVTWDYPNNAWPWESQAVITYKINIDSVQPAGIYNNLIYFVAIPSF